MNTNNCADARNTTDKTPVVHNETREVYFVMNRHSNTASLFRASCFEELQAMFRVGIILPDGTMVNGIGRCKNEAQFIAKAKHGGTRVQSYEL